MKLFVVGVCRDLSGNLLGFRTIDKNTFEVKYIPLYLAMGEETTNSSGKVKYTADIEFENFQVLEDELRPLSGAEKRYPLIILDKEEEYVMNPNLVVLYEIPNTGYIVSDGKGNIKFYTYRGLKKEHESGITVSNMAPKKSEKGFYFLDKSAENPTETILYNLDQKLLDSTLSTLQLDKEKDMAAYGAMRVISRELGIIKQSLYDIEIELQECDDTKIPEKHEEYNKSNISLINCILKSEAYRLNTIKRNWLNSGIIDIARFYMQFCNKYGALENLLDCLMKSSKDMTYSISGITGLFGLYIDNTMCDSNKEYASDISAIFNSYELKFDDHILAGMLSEGTTKISEELPYFQNLEAYMCDDNEITLKGVVQGINNYADLGIKMYLNPGILMMEGLARFIYMPSVPVSWTRKWIPDSLFSYENYRKAEHLIGNNMPEYEEKIAEYNEDSLEVAKGLEGLGYFELTSTMILSILELYYSKFQTKDKFDAIPATIKVKRKNFGCSPFGLNVVHITGVSISHKKPMEAIRIIEGGKVCRDLVLGYESRATELETAKGKSLGVIADELGNLYEIIVGSQERLKLLINRPIPSIIYDCFKTLYPHLVSIKLYISLAGINGLRRPERLNQWHPKEHIIAFYRYLLGISRVDGCVYLALEFHANSNSAIAITCEDFRESNTAAVPVVRFSSIEKGMNFYRKYCLPDGNKLASDKVRAGEAIRKINTKGLSEKYREEIIDGLKSTGIIEAKYLSEYFIKCNFLGTSYSELEMGKSLSDLGIVQVNPDRRKYLLGVN